MSAAYDYSISLFLRFVRLDFVDFDFNGTRAHPVRKYAACWHVSYSCVFAKRALVCYNTHAVGDPVPVDGRAVQESEGTLDRTSRDGWSRLGHCD